MSIFKRTKILASVGPPIDSSEMIEKMIHAGVNGFRLNFSHARYEDTDRQIPWIREASGKIGKPVAILQDLQGPKIRLGNLQHNVDVKKGDLLTLEYGAEHDGALHIPVQYNLAESKNRRTCLYIRWQNTHHGHADTESHIYCGAG